MSFLKKTGKVMADVIPGMGKFTYDNDTGKIFVTSGTGVVGFRVALSLLEAGHKDVRVGVWKGDRQGMDKSFGDNVAEKLEQMGAEVIEFNWANESDYAFALQGVKTVFCTLPHIEGWADVFPTFLKTCKTQKNVEHFVKLSFLRPTHDFKGVAQIARMYRDNVPFVAFHGTCDDLLEHAKSDSRISYTILCTSHIMSAPLLIQGKGLREDHKYISASYGMGVNYVSPNDVTDAAVVVLLNQKPHRNKVYNITGAGPTRDSEIVELLSRRYGSPIEHVQLGFHEYKADVKKRGLPEWMIRDAASMERMKAHGLDEHKSSYTKDYFEITGHQPESFEGYLDNTSCMRPGLTFP
mmetsp:Transcript_21376/g.27637  ORF Transcript_21376/g.27637 Transcript_21376/m.27637 type:complete len:352 (-) Transcript_21376:244-1299(-)